MFQLISIPTLRPPVAARHSSHFTVTPTGSEWQYSPSPPARIVRHSVPSFPALPHPLTPCLPGHPETVSEEFNGGPLVINPLPAGSSTSFGVNVGIWSSASFQCYRLEIKNPGVRRRLCQNSSFRRSDTEFWNIVLVSDMCNSKYNESVF